jgi:tRNA(fMet)-specific endonuclease VapC
MTPSLALLDTNAYTAMKLNDANVILVVESAPKIGVPLIVIGELLGGFEAGTRAEQNKHELERFLTKDGVGIVGPDHSTAEIYGRLYALLKRQENMIPTNDLWIAALAIRHEAELLTFDQHFERIPGLKHGSSWEALERT